MGDSSTDEGAMLTSSSGSTGVGIVSIKGESGTSSCGGVEDGEDGVSSVSLRVVRGEGAGKESSKERAALKTWSRHRDGREGKSGDKGAGAGSMSRT